MSKKPGQCVRNSRNHFSEQNLKYIVSLILFGKATYIKGFKLIGATGCNVMALPLAAGISYKQGILLSLGAGAVLMTLSTVIVAINVSMLTVKK